MRNRDAILQVLDAHLPASGTVLEVASGSGEHAVYFAPRLRGRYWLPSDIGDNALASIAAWGTAEPADNLLAPISIDASDPPWPIETGQLPAPITAIVSINMIHIAPWSAAVGLFAGAAELLPPGGVLYLYGPFSQGGEHISASNADFDISLKQRNAEWGVRDVDQVSTLANQNGFSETGAIPMPANNLSLVFVR
ncbi:hypothetical protein NOR51B_1879 [Luminiphilus syltensis NOR5-1B]|uniref:SAM-dependent methyltransferase n=1 Tax=Luminiphilus syltensis NOR5-1B TaxID=565045 RepID=B8KV36_9GAMM|nr:hypothetical protein NOR51B_1879 [Luminiphilus syltensis NOR5-1B]